MQAVNSLLLRMIGYDLLNLSVSKVIKISDSTELKLKELMKSLEETGCSPEEKIKARKIFKIYLDGSEEVEIYINQN